MEEFAPVRVPPPEELLRFIREGDFFVVAGHKDPDGDCAGSQLALVSALRRYGKKALACTAGPFKRTEIRQYISSYDALPPAQELKKARAIIVDCSSLERVGDLPLKGLPLFAIDHHASASEEQAPTGPVYLDPLAPSVTVLVLRVIKALGLSPTAEEAELLLFGLCTDTGFFRHVSERGANTFIAAAELTAEGASPKRVFAVINGGKSLASRILIGQIMTRTKAYCGGKVLVSREYAEDREQYGDQSRDSDMVYQLLMSVEGVEACALVRPDTEAPGKCNIGFRSREDVDVGAIAASFGGGGHKNASGASVPGSLDEVEARIVAAFEKIVK